KYCSIHVEFKHKRTSIFRLYNEVAILTEQSYPIEKIREEFPAMKRIGNNYFVGYCDGPGGTQVTKSVIEAISNYMKNGVANDGGESCTSKETENIVTQAREAIATLLGTEQQNIVFGENMTSLTFRIARTLQRMWRDSSGNIVITEMDHHANRDSWASAVEDLPLNVHSIPINPITKTLDTNHLEHIITNDTK